MPARNHRTIRTSQTSPLRIAAVDTADGGVIGMTFCPGKVGPGHNCFWERDVAEDLEAIAAWQADRVITLMEDHELQAYQVADLGYQVRKRLGDDAWLHLPIRDMDVPDPRFDDHWEKQAPRLHALLRDSGRVLLHCLGGLGRTGTIAARLLVETGVAPTVAIRRVRRARCGAIERDVQETYVRGLLDCQAVVERINDNPHAARRLADGLAQLDRRLWSRQALF
ncbi:phosphatase [Methylonatrum kenyense]|uniref:phosphatase domain-containing protein n=1 Tax=Methylonatrum kenyense TaxID=455253 RepID=UPI0020BF6DAF|nr:phosphatase [Methylonatrum kenyense]MCK8514994.1 phosphatase [Methylonatrum kenyense]